jgi:hypothetical protein
VQARDWSLLDHVRLWASCWWLIALFTLGAGAAASINGRGREAEAEGLLRIASIAGLGAVESPGEVVTRVGSGSFLRELSMSGAAEPGAGVWSLRAEDSAGLIRLYARSAEETVARLAVESTAERLAREHQPVVDFFTENARERIVEVDREIAFCEKSLLDGSTRAPSLVELLANLTRERKELRMQLDPRMVRRTQLMGPVIVSSFERGPRAVVSGALAGLFVGLLSSYVLLVLRRRSLVPGNEPLTS